MGADDTPPPDSDERSDPPEAGDPVEATDADRRRDAPPPAEPTPTAEATRAAPASPAGPAPGASKGMAIAALVLGIVALIFAFIPLLGAFVAIPVGIVAIVLGILARGRAKRTGTGGGLAMGGLITGIIGIVVALLWGLFLAGWVWQVERELPEFIEELEQFEDVEIPGGDEPGQ